MRAIVTGGAGFIGSYLCEELVKRNISISIWVIYLEGVWIIYVIY